MKYLFAFCVIWVGCGPIYSHSAPPPVGAPIAPGPMAGQAFAPMPPQHVGFLHGFPRRWEVRRWALTNDTKFFLKVRMNGREMIFLDNNVQVPHLPPYTTVDFVVSEYGPVVIEATGFLPPNYANPVVRCKVGAKIDPLTGGSWKSLCVSPISCRSTH